MITSIFISFIIIYIIIAYRMEEKRESKDALQKDITLELTKLNSLSGSIETLYLKKYTYLETIIKDELLSTAQLIDTKLIDSTEISESRLTKLREHNKFLCMRMSDYGKLVSSSSVIGLSVTQPLTTWYSKIQSKYQEASKAFMGLNDSYVKTLRMNTPKITLDILEDKTIVDKIKNEIDQLSRMALSRLENSDLRTASLLKKKCDEKRDEFIALMDWIITFRNKMHNIIFEIRVKESEVRRKWANITNLADNVTTDSFNTYNHLREDKDFYFNAIVYCGDSIKQINTLHKLIDELDSLERILNIKPIKQPDDYSEIWKDCFSEYDIHDLYNK